MSRISEAVSSIASRYLRYKALSFHQPRYCPKASTKGLWKMPIGAVVTGFSMILALSPPINYLPSHFRRLSHLWIHWTDLFTWCHEQSALSVFSILRVYLFRFM
ncbi:hypothetical protein CDAR_91971 [Caerostris darwini]|uniref:Uncharacterized protein n=1 Tax=Caerostris darwini TaxID=1538125 RepID=A0AAV4QSI1_9ARAC|nr:hypothetical protein CDAR_91971 [Caerostris darwini]